MDAVSEEGDSCRHRPPPPHFSQKAKARAGIGDKSMAEEEICSLSCKVNRLTHGYHPCPLPDRHFL